MASSNPFDTIDDPTRDAALDTDLLADVDALLMAPDLDALLQPQDATLLRELLNALQGNQELRAKLGAFTNEHCRAFASYSPDAEHALEWSALHAHYSAIFDGAVEAVLRTSGRPAWEVFGVVQVGQPAKRPPCRPSATRRRPKVRAFAHRLRWVRTPVRPTLWRHFSAGPTTLRSASSCAL